MSIARQPLPAKLVVGLIVRDKKLLDAAAADLVDSFGPLEMVSPWYPFDYTAYYAREMGSPLFRRILVFKELVDQERLVQIKLETNRLEGKFSAGSRRRVNIDPGLLTYERFVLATGKNYTHRIYLGKGIFADLTLVYRKGGFQALDWTYPDYAGRQIRTFLEKVRARYRRQLRTSEIDVSCDGKGS